MATHLGGDTVDVDGHSLPKFIPSISALNTVVAFVNGCTICGGNPDEKFVHLAEARKGKFIDASGMLASYAYIDTLNCDMYM